MQSSSPVYSEARRGHALDPTPVPAPARSVVLYARSTHAHLERVDLASPPSPLGTCRDAASSRLPRTSVSFSPSFVPASLPPRSKWLEWTSVRCRRHCALLRVRVLLSRRSADHHPRAIPRFRSRHQAYATPSTSALFPPSLSPHARWDLARQCPHRPKREARTVSRDRRARYRRPRAARSIGVSRAIGGWSNTRPRDRQRASSPRRSSRQELEKGCCMWARTARRRRCSPPRGAGVGGRQGAGGGMTKTTSVRADPAIADRLP